MKIFTRALKTLMPVLLFWCVILTTNQIAFSQYVCQLQGAVENISSSLEAADPDQSTRVFRGGQFLATTCNGGTPTGAPVAGTYNHEAITRTNTSGQPACVTVELSTACTATNFLFAVAYSSYNPATPNANIIGNIGASPGGLVASPASFSFPVAAGASYTVVVSEVTANAGCPNYTLKLYTRTGCRQAGYDRTNDGNADLALFRPTALGQWLDFNIATSIGSTRQFGQTGDIPTAGDYTGDNQTDLSVYRPSNNTWYYATNQANPSSGFVGRPWGMAGDVPVPGDYDRDGRNDVSIWRPSTGEWFILSSLNNVMLQSRWGQSGDTPIVGDFDGDMAWDQGVTRVLDGSVYWLIRYSNFGYTASYPNTATQNGSFKWGLPTDKLVPADYDGDGRSDIGVWRPSDGIFYVRLSNNGGVFQTAGFQWGINGDVPQPADYDGDRKADFAVWRPSNAVWYIHRSSSNTFNIIPLGNSSDQPATSAQRVTP